MVYDLCIVGTGLWGSAASRHATTKPGRNVCLIGPGEPQPKDRPMRDIFASHYDSGRSVRKYQETSHTRSLMTMRTFTSLKELQKTTGINLNADIGHIMHGNKIRDTLVPIAESRGILLDAAGVRDRFPFLNTQQYGDAAIFFPDDSGYVDPRRLVQAQQKAARRQGCDIIDDVVEAVEDSEQRGSDGQQLMRLTTKTGRTLTARRVLLCTGLFTDLKSLLPKGVKLNLEIVGTFTVKLEVAEVDAEKLRTMPTLTSYTDPEWDCYILPPIKYPNGKHYIKIGPMYQDQTTLNTLGEVKDWYLSQPDQKLVQKYKDMLLGIVTGISPISVDVDMCACARTPTALPYCDMITPRLGLAVGGNGFGAMTSDEMGRMAAEMVAGTENWNLDIPREELKAQFIHHSSNL